MHGREITLLINGARHFMSVSAAVATQPVLALAICRGVVPPLEVGEDLAARAG